MEWTAYWDVLRRRWWLIGAIILLDVLGSAYLYSKSARHAGYQSCATLYVADVSSPSLISAPSSLLDTAGQLLAGETAANFFADDILDVARSSRVASFVAARLAGRNLPNTAPADINGAVSGSRLDRTVSLCVSNPNAASAQAVATQMDTAMTSARSRFIGTQMGRRTFVTVISPPTTAAVSTRHLLLSFGLRVALGVLLALGLAFLWDALDPHVRNRADLMRALDVPVIEVPR